MKKSIYLFFALICFLAASCTKEKIVEIPSMIDILNTDGGLEMGPGSTEELLFQVYPPEIAFNYDVSSPQCQIRLVVDNATGLNYEESEYYRMIEVVQVSKEDGIYSAKIHDLNKSIDYRERILLYISNLQTGADERHVASWKPFVIEMQQTWQIALKDFVFFKNDNPEAIFGNNIRVNINSGEAIVISPMISNPNLIARFNKPEGVKVYVDGVEQISGETMNDFSKPIKYTVKDRIEYSFTVQVIHSALPKVFIRTQGGMQIPSKNENWLSATVKIYNPDWTLHLEGETDIRGRGNTTWTYPKKPYALKLKEKQEVLGMPKHKRWVLLANWMDRTLLRNAASFNLASRTSLAYTPRGEFVELFVNDVHLGNYFLCEHIKVDENRVNIDELDEDEVDGGYIMELDAYYDEVHKFKSAVRNLPYMFKDPDEVSAEQFSFMQDYVNNFENSLYDNARFAKREYVEYIDLQSFADWWITMELTGIWEPNHPKSTYMHKDKGGKLTMGPVWDFDWETYMSTTWFRIKDALYYGRLFQDPEFVALVKERWAALKPEFETFPEYIRSKAEHIRSSEYMNHMMWPITQVVNKDESMSFDDAVESMIASYTAKLEWMDKEIGKM